MKYFCNVQVIATILSITLKLTGCIDWSWFWVLSPFWIVLVLRIVAVLLIDSFKYTSDKYIPYEDYPGFLESKQKDCMKKSKGE